MKIFLKIFLLIFTCTALLYTSAFAAGNQFTVGVTVGEAAPVGGSSAGDSTRPGISALNPANGAIGVPATTTLSITFNELVSKQSGNIRVKKYVDDSVAETVAVSGAQVTLVGAVATISLASPLSSNTQYYVEIDADTFVDQSANTFLGISGKSTWVFTVVDTEAPTVGSVSATSTYTTATIIFTTSESARATLLWGTSTAYELGSASETSFLLAHSMGITGLATSTLYYYRLTAKDASNNQSAPSSGTFTTESLLPPPDTTAPANPSGLAATPSQTSIALSWSNPPDLDFAAVRVMRKTIGYPSSEEDGILVYDGDAESAIDGGLLESTRYYYSAFARDNSGNYSSGAIVSAETKSARAEEPPPPSLPESETEGEGEGGGQPSSGGEGATVTPGSVPGPFIDMPATGTPHPIIRALSLNDFDFVELGEDEQRLFPEDGSIRVDGKKNLKVAIDYDKLPDVLKTITITVLEAGGKTSSYLLRVNPDKTAFEALLPPFGVSDSFPFAISIVDYDAKGLTRLPGVLVSSYRSLPSVFPPAISAAIDRALESIEEPVAIVAPILTPVGVAVGVSQAVLLATNASSLYDLYLLLLKLMGLLTGVFRRKRSEPWGVVYDSVTKRPLDPAYVIAQVKESKRAKGEAITDLDGRYGFLLDPGEYEIIASKTHYKFPSDKLKGRGHDELYENLYFGEPFLVREGGVVQYDIPLDPVEFDWNEFAKNQDHIFRLYSRKEFIRRLLFNVVFFAGFAFSILSFFLTPSPLNGVIVGIYGVVLLFQSIWRATHKVVRVMNKETRKPIPFALIKLWFPGLNTIAKKIVADEMGRFYALISPGRYTVTVEEKLPDGSYKEVLRSEGIELKRGVIMEDLLI